MKTKILFGMFLDGADWSEAPASIGELRLGPAGMLGYLETRLGMTAKQAPEAIRINQYMARIEALDLDKAWFHGSFLADPWSTAKQMLGWRDELKKAGWTGSELTSSSRLAAISDIEKSKVPLSPGFGDRLQAIETALAGISALDIAKVELIEAKEVLPPMWQKIINGLSAIGIDIVEAPKPDDGVLSRVEDILMLQANNEWEAAETIATWLAANPDANKDVTIVCGAGTRLLDQALAKRGLPTIGVSGSTPWRPYIQLLPLALANIWTPVDVGRLVDLLSLPVSLVRRNEAFYLLNAIAKEPGVGGDAWQLALEKIEAAYINKATDGDPDKATPSIKEEAAKRGEWINYLLVQDRHSEDEGANELTIADRCFQAIQKLYKSRGLIPEYVTAIKHAETMLELVKGRKVIDKKLLERMVDSVAAPASGGSDEQQVGAWRVVSDPRQVVASIETLIWWGFNEPADMPLTYWTNEERQELIEGGAVPEEQIVIRNREAAAARRALASAKNQAILVCPDQINGEAVAYHPVWDELTAGLTKKEIEKHIVSASSLAKESVWRFAGRNVDFEKREREIFEPPREQQTIPKDQFRSPETNSPSQMGTMISCPFNWTLQYQAKIKPAPALDAPAENQMKGIFCHRIAEDVLGTQKLQADPEAARHEAQKIYDELVPQMAAPMLVKGKARENERLRNVMGEAIASLATILNERGLTVIETEKEHEKPLSDGMVFRGIIDMVAQDKAGRRFVIDLKWTGSAKKKDEEINEGRALQLAGYTWLLKSETGDEEIGGGYYLLAQDDYFDSDDFSETWQRGLNSWVRRAEQIDDGKLAVTGIIKENIKSDNGLTENKTIEELKDMFEADGLIYRETFCRYCDYTVLCGVTEAAE